jgi:Lrp/AsnC family transcriptional regulator for asnA, asnC and gidA
MSTTLDELDRSIIRLMRVNPRVPTKSLAHDLDVTEQTVSVRIRKLTQSNLLRVVVQSDVYAMGYEFVCLADIYVSGRTATGVGRDLEDVAGVSSVVLTLGAPEIIVMFHTVDRADFQRIVTKDFAEIEGVDRLETFVSMHIAKYRTEFAQLSHD